MSQSLRIRLDLVQEGLTKATLNDAEKTLIQGLINNSQGKRAVDATAQDYPKPLLHWFLDSGKLSGNQAALVNMEIHGVEAAKLPPEQILQQDCTSPLDFGGFWGALTKQHNAEVFLNGRWYPISLKIDYYEPKKGEKYVFLIATLLIAERSYNISCHVSKDYFRGDDGRRAPKKVVEILNKLGFRPITGNVVEFNLKLMNASRMIEHGKQMNCTNSVIHFTSKGWGGDHIDIQVLGTPTAPKRVIQEPELEAKQRDEDKYSSYRSLQHDAGDEGSRLPFVRVFCLTTKRYYYADVEDLTEYEYDATAMGKIHLPAEMKEVLQQVFTTPMNLLFGDILRGKHGGIVVMASGSPGVGKTLTAEVYSEMTERPLYVLELGELGTSLDKIEENLSRIFTRVIRWNAVLQFDECEVFLTERSEDLERSAIVGVFLRLLDYYHGILFLTTNRPQVIDHAIISRVMLKLEYPPLEPERRKLVWQTMFREARITFEGDIDKLASIGLNGRQIRNLTRLTRILFPSGTVNDENLDRVMKYGVTATPSV